MREILRQSETERGCEGGKGGEGEREGWTDVGEGRRETERERGGEGEMCLFMIIWGMT